MISYEQKLAIERFADALRKKLAIPKDTDNFVDRIKKIIFEYVWDILVLTQQEFDLEFDEWSMQLEEAYRNGKK